MSLNQAGEGKPLWSVMVSSFDDSCDLWPIFFHFLFKYWPDVPTPIYLVTNFRKYDDERVVSLCVGEDKSWGETITKSLAQIESKHVWMLLDDFFLKAPIQTQNIDRIVRGWDALGGKYLETGRRGKVGEIVSGTDFRHIPSSNPQAGINSAFYEREFLGALAQPGWSLWQGNSALRKLNLDDHPDIYYQSTEVPPMIEFVESVKGKFWKPMAMDYLAEHHIEPDLRWRPYPPQGQDVFRKLIRSIHKRRMERRKRRDARNYSMGRPAPLISPLTGPQLKVRVIA